MNYSKPRLPDDLPSIISRLRLAAKNEGWNQHNLVMELCDKAEFMYTSLTPMLPPGKLDSILGEISSESEGS